MNIFENFNATKLFLELLDDCKTHEDKEEFRKRIKALFNAKVTSDEELDHYLLTAEDIQHEYDQFRVDHF